MTHPPTPATAPPPQLRIVPTASLRPHEEHDTQRLIPLVERIKHETVMINPPIVAQIDEQDEQYVVLDGANRTSAFARLGYPYILVQVVDYHSPFVQLETWHHVVCAWTVDELERHLYRLPEIMIEHGDSEMASDVPPLAHIQLRDSHLLTIAAATQTTQARNHALSQVVAVYQRNAVLHRTALNQPDHVWSHHPDGVALVLFPAYRPADVIEAAREHAFVPPGITRHIIHGRALKVNFPLEWLQDADTPLDEHNRRLSHWIEEKVNRRQVRYYAESTYQFDE